MLLASIELCLFFQSVKSKRALKMSLRIMLILKNVNFNIVVTLSAAKNNYGELYEIKRKTVRNTC